VFELAADAVESGYDLRLVIRELARLTRDLLVIGVDPSRLADPEIAAESERERLQALAAQFSAEDLMRAFDVLTKAEFDIRGSLQPRYHLEMALLRWIHLRRLVPLTDLIQGLEKTSGRGPSLPTPPAPRVSLPVSGRVPPRPPSASAATVKAVEARREEPPRAAAQVSSQTNGSIAASSVPPPAQAPATPAAGTDLKDAFLAEVQKSKKFFYGTVVAQAQKIEIQADRVVITFAPQHRALRQQLEQTRSWLEEIASGLAGRRMSVVGAEASGAASAGRAAAPAGDTPAPEQPPDRQTTLKQQALADSAVQAMLDVFAAEIKEVEER
jgi:DNA polymerase-3 subunit gamma/tau